MYTGLQRPLETLHAGPVTDPVAVSPVTSLLVWLHWLANARLVEFVVSDDQELPKKVRPNLFSTLYPVVN
jgi:hypothetical protein